MAAFGRLWGRLLLATLLLSSGRGQAQTTAAPSPSLAIGDPTPALKVGQWLKGRPVQGFEKGKVYVVEFWATWCKPCIAGMPHLSELARQYRGTVTVAGISVMERKTTTLPQLQAFVTDMGAKMDYNVAADADNYMATNWLRAFGERGIPAAFVVDQQGRIAWFGLPAKLDAVLPKIVAGQWDMQAAAAARKKNLTLAAADNATIERLNPYMGNPGNPQGALAEIEKLVAANPDLKYAPRMGNFTLYSLVKTKPDEALAYTRQWLTVSETPDWATVVDVVEYSIAKNLPVPKAFYELGVECLQAQIDHYPWSMPLPATYDRMAAFHYLAANKAQAVAAEKQALAASKQSTSVSLTQLAQFEKNLQKYQGQ